MANIKVGSVSAIPGANLPLTLGPLSCGWVVRLQWWIDTQLGGIGVANEVANVFLNTNAAASGGLIAASYGKRLLVARRT